MTIYFEKNLAWMNKTFEKLEIPKEDAFLKKYFKTRIQKSFLNYYYCMRGFHNFTDHTGVYAEFSFLHRLASKFNLLVKTFKKAKEDMDLDMINDIMQHKFRIPRKYL